MKKSKRSLKGMTLAEIVVSMAVLVILAAMMVIAAASAIMNMRTANNVSRKTAVQAPYAANRSTGGSSDEDDDEDVPDDSTITLSGSAGDSSFSGTLTVKKYAVKQGTDSKDQVGDFRYFEYQRISDVETD